jgi:DNA-binding transcriptional LysR family regulator
MELRHVRYFVAAAEELNFRRAAERLHVSQPALSVQIRQIEDELGATLLDRDRHHVALTAAGKVFLDHGRRLLRAADEAMRAAGRAARGETGRLAIGFIAQLSYEWLPSVLRSFRKRYADVEISLTELTPTRQIEELVDRRIDLGIIGLGLPQPHDELEVAVMSEERLVAALPLDHPLAHRRTLALSELAREKFIFTARHDAPAFSPWLLALCQRAGFEPQIALETDRSPSALNYVAAGFGVALFPAQIGRLAMPSLRFVPLDKSTPKYQLCVAWRKDNRSPALERFLATARDVVRGGGAVKNKE